MIDWLVEVEMRKEQGCKKKPGIPEKPGNL